MPVMDGGQPRPNADNTVEDDRKNSASRPKRVRGADPGSYAKWGKAHYEKNKAAYIARAAEAKERGRAEWAAYKATLSCTKCGEAHPATLDFHHVVRLPENKKVFRLVGSGQFAKAKEEIKKCIVLCANCHRKLHFEEDQKKKGAEAPHR